MLTASGGIVEIQGTAEQMPFSGEQFLRLLELAQQGTAALAEAQRQALNLTHGS